MYNIGSFMNSDLNNVFLWKATLDVKSGNMTEPVFAPIVSNPEPIREPLSRIEELELELKQCKDSSCIYATTERLLVELKPCTDISSRLEEGNTRMEKEIEQLNVNHTQKTKDLEEQISNLRGIEIGIEQTQKDLQECLSRSSEISHVDANVLSLEKKVSANEALITDLQQKLVDENNLALDLKDDIGEQIVDENNERIRNDQELKTEIETLKEKNTETLQELEKCKLARSQLPITQQESSELQQKLEKLGEEKASLLQKLQELGIGENDLEQHKYLVDRIKYLDDVDTELSKRITNSSDDEEKNILEYARFVLANTSITDLNKWRYTVNTTDIPRMPSIPTEEPQKTEEDQETEEPQKTEEPQETEEPQDHQDVECNQVEFDYGAWVSNPAVDQTPDKMAEHMSLRLNLTPSGDNVEFSDRQYVGENGTTVSNKELMFKYGFVSSIGAEQDIMSHKMFAEKLAETNEIPETIVHVRVYEGNVDGEIYTRNTEYKPRSHVRNSICGDKTPGSGIVRINMRMTNIGHMYKEVLEILQTKYKEADLSGDGKLRLMLHLIKYLGIHTNTNTDEYVTILSGNVPEESLGSSILSDMSSMFMWL